MSRQLLFDPLKQIFSFLSSLKTAIPLLVITIVVTIAGSLLPSTDFFRSWWYLSLLGLNGISLLFITILHIPMILERKGRNALIGVVATHMGILVLIAGTIYGLSGGFRHEIRAIENEMTVVPGLPFVIQLDGMIVEEYAPGEVGHLDPAFVPKKRQESHLSFYKGGELWEESITAPGKPARLGDITVLPSFKEIGWVFDLIVIDWRGNEKVVPVRPWLPTIMEVRGTEIMLHNLEDTEGPVAQIFTQVDGQVIPLGLVSPGQSVDLNGFPIKVGDTKRYTGLIIYNRPHAPVLVAGCLVMLFGLVWHFYFRHRDRKATTKP